MKKHLLLIPAALGLLALIPTKSRAQDFGFGVSVGRGYYAPGYYNGGYCDPGYGYYYRHGYYGPTYYRPYYYGYGHYRSRYHFRNWDDDD